MSFLRSTALRASSLTRAVRPTRYVRAAELQPWQRAVQRRTYASAHGAEAQGSEVPWMAAAVAGTVGGLYIVITQDTGAGHHDDHHGEAHETHHEKEGGDEESEDDESKDEEPKKTGEGMAQGGPKDEAKTKDKNTESGNEQSDNAGSAATGKPDKKKAADSSKDAPKADEAGAASPDRSDKADPRGKPKSSNEPPASKKDPTKSKKGEGVAETAKLKGTVSVDRPGAENKEERGKAQQENDK